MAKSLGLRELNQGNIIKVELGNGETLRGCFYGKKIYKEKTTWEREVSITGNFLVVIDPVKKETKLIDITDYSTKKKTTVKGIYATRFPKEVSAYLKKYVLALAKQQKMMLEELRLQAKRELEDKKLEQLKSEVQALDYEVDGDSLPIEQRVAKVFDKLAIKSGMGTSPSYVGTPNLYNFYQGNVLHINLVFNEPSHVMDRDLGITPDFEYDGSYSPTVDPTFDLTNTAVKELGINRTDIAYLLQELNGIQGIKTKGTKLFRAYTGDYPNDGTLEFDVELLVDEGVSEKALEQAMNRLALFIKKA